MSWRPVTLKDNGRDRHLVVVLCDHRIPATSPAGVTVTCHTSTEVPARNRDETADRIQRVLVARGWSWDNTDGRDYCPLCTQLREEANVDA